MHGSRWIMCKDKSSLKCGKNSSANKAASTLCLHLRLTEKQEALDNQPTAEHISTQPPRDVL